ncbi:SpoIIE family protein phosphatase [uncultured Ramlibacter sp.]|uniref:PP2C family protein-serine/threonine phosphatase n=1 Tax=uncultured Ramlibacter sp. TaxID=260755 RepID=UPI002603FC09|nr:SpoIIE family protein phosphatase [uncultured Ramlibacter sp.]
MSVLSDGPQHRLLVVDDNEMNRDLLSRRLQRQGFLVELAQDGQQALEAIAAQAFDLILLDIMMPVMNGYDLLERLKADPALRHIPVIMITAIDDAESIARCIDMGAEDHLPKPFNPAILRARVDSALAKKRLRDREQVYAKSLERELAIGRDIQRSFLPDTLPSVDGWDLSARFQPARQVAGDFYDAFALPDGRLGLVMADVCDKGVGAALFMALFRSLLRVLARQEFSDPDPRTVVVHTLASINDYIAQTHSKANMFATVFFAVLSPATGELQYVNAGHDPPVVLDPGSPAPRRLAPTGPAVGLQAGLLFRAESTVLAPGALLLAFTDGVTDARDQDAQMFGEDRLLALLGAEPDASVGALLDSIEAALASHVGDGPRFDDISLLAVRHG